jgi:epoxyqueuosine reductase
MITPKEIFDLADELGFTLHGIVRAAPAETHGFFAEWLAAGQAGEMAYLARHADARRHPASILETVRSVVMLGVPYDGRTPNPAPVPGQGRVARYARGPDYHREIWDRLDRLLAGIQARQPCAGRGVVDTAPLLERDFARRAGLGWIGKNTMLIHPRQGSYFFIAALLVDLDLEPTPPLALSYCGTCTACLDACPTQAFPGPRVLDARRCTAYHTIEQRTAIAGEFRGPLADHLFGCDICQEVCPWNRFAGPGSLPTRPDLVQLDAREILAMDESAFKSRFRGTALERARRSGLRRNAALVLGNSGDASAKQDLLKHTDDADPVVREAVAWAIERLTINPS